MSIRKTICLFLSFLPLLSSASYDEGTENLYEAAHRSRDLAREVFRLEANPDLTIVQPMTTYAGKGLFASYSLGGKVKGSFLFVDESRPAIDAIFEGENIPVGLDNRYAEAPYVFVSKEEYEEDKKEGKIPQIDYDKTIPDDDKPDSGLPYAVSIPSTFDSQYYFDLPKGNLYSYGSQELSEGRIQAVPNYLNTLFSHKGCVPTTAAMYFAYLARSNENYSSLAPDNMPLSTADSEDRVNQFIYELGKFYFHTDSDHGTLTPDECPGYDNYLSDHNFPSYQAEFVNFHSDNSGRSFLHYYRIINETVNPVPLFILMPKERVQGYSQHSVLGIGYRELPNADGYKMFITANMDFNNCSQVVSFNMSWTCAMLPIHQKVAEVNR